ncbi:unnamed protein product [Rhizophagus irregularis]|nr:unnamed protein product [Rhizophagus irregularis]
MLQRPLRRSWKHGMYDGGVISEYHKKQGQENYNEYLRAKKYLCEFMTDELTDDPFEECRTIRKHFSRTRNMFDACVQPGTTIIEVGPYTIYSAHTMFFRYTKHQNLFFLRRSFHSSVISKNDMLQL